MKTLTLIAITIGFLAGFAQAAIIPNPDMVLTIDFATGAATLKNVGTVAHKVELYQIKSPAHFLNPGTRASVDPITGDITPSTPGAWQGICDDLITNPQATVAAFGPGVSSFGPLTNTRTATKSIAEATLAGYANFNAGFSWGIGNPLQPGKASLTDLAFYWTEFNQNYVDTYAGPIVITPEPATLGLVILGGLAAIRRRR